MGRYAFFSTGMEYKFWFAVQNSADILEFGGQSRNHRGPDMGMIQWSHKLDFDFIVRELSLLMDKDTQNVKAYLDSHSKNLDGTLTIQQDRDVCSKKAEISAKICLGLVIAHQLLQEPDLTVEYEEQ